MSTIIITGSATLRELVVSYNDIGDNGISVVTEGLQSSKTLTKLDVSGCRFSMKGTVLYNMFRYVQWMMDDWCESEQAPLKCQVWDIRVDSIILSKSNFDDVLYEY